jgi:NADPH2:quinone reductase
MNESFHALLSEEGPGKKVVSSLKSFSLKEALQNAIPRFSQGEVLIRAEYSSLNYKDALGITGQGRIFKSLPMVGGIDVVGKVISSSVPDFRTGQSVLVTGCNLGETYWGGYSEIVNLPAEHVVPLPEGLTSEEAMILGTAAFTAALCYWRFIKNDQAPAMGPIAVTGASGGVGSFAVQLFSQQGFEVIAVSGRKEHSAYLKGLGASQCLTPAELNLGARPLESVKFGGVVDNVGGEQLAALCRHVQLWGNVGSIGLAGGAEFHSTVMPHILRGVSILGISSNNCTKEVRREIWKHLSGDWKPRDLEKIHQRTVGLDDLMITAEKLLNRELSGRVLVKLS